jgi:hypothetical protein
MDHVVYLDAKAKEYSKLVNGTKTMIIRGAAGRKLPYGRVFDGDSLYFIENDGSGLIKAKAKTSKVIHSEKMNKDESIAMVEAHQEQLQLTNQQNKRWAGKRYLVLIEIKDFVELEPFKMDRSEFGNMDDWLPVEDIARVKI